MTTTLICGTDRFDWRRVWLLARTYMPRLRWLLILYPLIAIAVTLLSKLLWIGGLGPISFTIENYCVYLIIFAPLILAPRRGLEMMYMLPVRASERFAFVAITFFVVVPMLYFVPQQLLAFAIFDTKEIIREMVPFAADPEFFTLLKAVYVILYGSTLCSTITTLLIVVRRTRNRIGLAIVGGLGVNIVIGFIYGLALGLTGFYIGYRMAVTNQAVPTEAQLFNDMLTHITYTTYAMYILIFAYLGAALWMLLRSFNARQM